MLLVTTNIFYTGWHVFPLNIKTIEDEGINIIYIIDEKKDVLSSMKTTY